MTLVANSNGVVSGKFTIPANVRAGTKRVRFEGAGGSYANANFFGQGVVETRIMQEQITLNTVLSPAPIFIRLDPLAQTFSLPTKKQIGAVDLHVTAKGSTPIVVQIRETEVGFPTRTILAETQLAPVDISVNAWNRFTFARPVPLMPDVEYALVVLCNDAVGAVSIAQLGKFDANLQQWVTSQPYQVGVLLSSSNAATWTAHQDRDLAFRLLAANYTEAERTLDLGNVAVTDATDLMVLTTTDQPSADANCEIELTMPDTTVVKASDGQVIRLDSAITGNVGVKAKLRSTADESAVLAPGMQVVAGEVSLSADYITRAFEADAAGADVSIIFDALLPSGSGVAVYIKGDDIGDSWAAVSQDGIAKPIGDGVFEYKYAATGVTEAKLRVKLVLTGTIAARPFVYNLRVSVT